MLISKNSISSTSRITIILYAYETYIITLMQIPISQILSLSVLTQIIKCF